MAATDSATESSVRRTTTRRSWISACGCVIWPNTHYNLQRAVDTIVDDECTGTLWLTLGKGTTPQDIVTDDAGTGREDLFRLLTSPIGTAFDIHFRVVSTAMPPAVALISDCYQCFVR